MGFSLDEIRELLLLHHAGEEACSHVHELLDQKLTMIRRKISELRVLERHLKEAKVRCDRELAKACVENCPVIEEIARNRKGKQWQTLWPPIDGFYSACIVGRARATTLKVPGMS